MTAKCAGWITTTQHYNTHTYMHISQRESTPDNGPGQRGRPSRPGLGRSESSESTRTVRVVRGGAARPHASRSARRRGRPSLRVVRVVRVVRVGRTLLGRCGDRPARCRLGRTRTEVRVACPSRPSESRLCTAAALRAATLGDRPAARRRRAGYCGGAPDIAAARRILRRAPDIAAARRILSRYPGIARRLPYRSAKAA